jgi:hypothetical protein
MEHLDSLLQQQQQQLQQSHIVPPISSADTASSSNLQPDEQQQQQAEADMTYATASSFDEPPPARHAPKSAMRKPSGAASGLKKPGPGTAAMRKKRELEIAGYIDMLPLEYRGREPVSPQVRLQVLRADVQAMRLGMEKVIGVLMANPAGVSSEFTPLIALYAQLMVKSRMSSVRLNCRRRKPISI